MNFSAVVVIIAATIACVSCSGYGASGGSSYGGASGGSSYGGSSMPAPPCPKNYLFSCQPQLVPAPCSQQSSGYGSAGAYSENVNTYVGAPQQLPQQYQQRTPFYNFEALRNFYAMQQH